MATASLHYSGETHIVSIPDYISTKIITPNKLPVTGDALAAFKKAISCPIGCKRPREFVKAYQTVAVIITDICRDILDDLAVTCILDELSEAGVPDSNICIVIATGLHRPNTPEEIVEMLGREVPARVWVVNHVANDPDQIISLGKTPSGLPVTVNRQVAEADIRIATGVIEPHKLAGYSGGVKAMSVGVAGEESIRASHSLEMMSHPSMRMGVIKGNPFREFLNEFSTRVGLDFITNVVMNDNKEIIQVVAGHPHKAFEEGVRIARQQSEVKLDGPADLVIAVPGYPKERNLYQSLHALDTVIYGLRPVVEQGGTMLVPARCQDGLGDLGLYDYWAPAPNPGEFIQKLQREELPIGYTGISNQLEGMLHVGEIYYTDCLIEQEVLNEMSLRYAATLQEAIDEVVSRKNPKSALVMPQAAITLPVIE